MNNPRINAYFDFERRQVSFDRNNWTIIPHVDSLPLTVALADSYINNKPYMFKEGFYDAIELHYENITDNTKVRYPFEFNIQFYNNTIFNTYFIFNGNVFELTPNTSIRIYFLFMNPFNVSTSISRCGNPPKDVTYNDWIRA